jgi:hypothetical protein
MGLFLSQVGEFFSHDDAQSDLKEGDNMGGRNHPVSSYLIFALLALFAALLMASAAAETTDSDSDGFSDDVEEDAGTDPDDDEDYPPIDSDGDGFTDDYEDDEGTDPEDDDEYPPVDSDGDGFTDDYEDDEGTDPYDEDDKPEMEEAKKDDWFTLLSVTMILTFAVFIIAAGGFTVYFGAGKSRGIGGGLLGLGIAILAVSYWIRRMSDDQTLLSILTWDVSIIQLLVTVIGAAIGFVVAVVLFLVTIMKS